MGLECCCFRGFAAVLHSQLQNSLICTKRREMSRSKLGEGKNASFFAVYTMSCFFFSLIHAICSLNLTIVVCVVTEPAVLIYYVHESHDSHVSEYHFNWKCFLTVLRLYLLLSRSEANDLALRLARQYCGHQDVITLEK